MNAIISVPVIRADNRNIYIQSHYKLLSYCGKEETVNYTIITNLMH